MKVSSYMAAGALVLGLALPGTAIAQTVASTADVNMRAGPGTRFPVVTTIPQNRNVNVIGCDQNLDWCDVEWRGNRGWVFADYLTVSDQRRSGPLAEIGRLLSVPFAAFNPDNYWDQHYRDRPWYDDRQRWGTTGGVQEYRDGRPRDDGATADERTGRLPLHQMR
jgi:uncharacterized protein YraI